MPTTDPIALPDLRDATTRDIPALVALVNAAYRPADAQAAGWTHETGLLGGTRTDAQQVAALLAGPGVVLVAQSADQLLGCVLVEPHGDDCHIGMLSTLPALQNRGLGRHLLAMAEQAAITRLHARALVLGVVSSRPELLAWYQRRGWTLSGATQPFPHDAGVGTPLVDGLQVLEMRKPCA